MRSESRADASALETGRRTSIGTRYTVALSTVSTAGSDGLTAVVSTETVARLPNAAATARHWTAAALISGWYAPVTSSTRSTAGRSRKGAAHHGVEEPRGAPDVELLGDGVERRCDAECSAAPSR